LILSKIRFLALINQESVDDLINPPKEEKIERAVEQIIVF